MARKIYKTKSPVISLSFGLVIPDKKDKVYISFTGGIRFPTFVPSTLIVSDEKVQEALESTKQFGKKFEIAKVFKEEPKQVINVAGATKTQEAPVVEETKPEPTEPEEPVVKVKKIPQVKTVNGAITNLITSHGADPDGLDTLEDVIRVAKEKNVLYPNLPTE